MRWFGRRTWSEGGRSVVGTATTVARKGAQFDVTVDPGILYGQTTWPTIPTYCAKVSRREAMSVPAVKRGRDIICGSIGSLPLRMRRVVDGKVIDWPLFDQPEADVPSSVTLTRTIEDLLFHEVAWWRIVTWGWHNKPVEVVRLDPLSVSVRQDSRVFYNRDGQAQGASVEWIPDEQLIRFDSPTDGILRAGARAIRSCLALDQAALRYSEGNQPLDWFESTDGIDPDDPQALIDDWHTARKANVTGYVPAGLSYKTGGWDPMKLQLAEQRQHAVTEIARLMGIDAEDLQVSTTSRTYQNNQDRRRDLIDFTLGEFIRAVEGRLSMDQVTPRGYEAFLDLSDFLKSDDATRMDIATVGLAGQVLTEVEARTLYGLQPEPDGPTGLKNPPAPNPKAVNKPTPDPSEPVR